MKSPWLVGITGGIGSGKSMVSSIFRALSVPVYDSDTWAKKLMTSDKAIQEKIKATFGHESFASDGSLNRVYLASHVFASPNTQKQMNDIVHPHLANHFNDWVQAHQHHHYVLNESALLLDPNTPRNLNQYIVVTCPVALRMERILKRDKHRSKDDIEKIMSIQRTDEEFMQEATFIIRNDDRELVIPQVLQLHQQLVRL